MKEFSTTVGIDAPPDTVWGILIDGAAYSAWNPEILQVAGRIDRGEPITAHVRLGSGAVRRVRLVVSAFDAPRGMVWRLSMPFGLFVGLRTLTVAPSGRGCEFRLHLQMSGPMLPLILKSVGNRQPEVDAFAAALKSHAEGLTARTRVGPS